MKKIKTENTAPLCAVSFKEAFYFWLKLGFISFGGPTGQIAIMHQELVERKRWISERRFLHALNYCMILPGPEAQQLATYLGWLMHSTWGGIMAGALFILPSLFILILFSWIYCAYGDLPLVTGIFYGMKPAVTALVVHAAYRIGAKVLKNSVLALIALASFIAMFSFNIPFSIIVLTAALIGGLGGQIHPQKFSHGGGHSRNNPEQNALIDDHTPQAEHTKFSRRKLRILIIVGAALWLLPMLLLIFHVGWDGMLTQMGWFFTKAAFLTFGGAYAVLPYVYQFTVNTVHWLTAQQMIDGLALGETTPGPLIMIVTFVGFVGGYGKALFGPDLLFLSGALAAIVATFFTFLPSFLFILIGAPLMELTHNEIKFTAPLTAITAAVVGVIVNLALFFAYFVFWPKGFADAVDWSAVFIFALAALLLQGLKRSVISVIGVCVAIGLLCKNWILLSGFLDF